MKKVIVLVLLALLACGFVMAQTVTKDNVVLVYDPVGKVLRLQNLNTDPTQVQATNGKTAISGVMKPLETWEVALDAAPAENALQIVKVTTGPKLKPAVAKGWKAVASVAAPAVPAVPAVDPKAPAGKAAAPAVPKAAAPAATPKAKS